MWANKYAYAGGGINMADVFTKVTGVVTRKSKAGFQLDNVNKWYNRHFKYEGVPFDDIQAGSNVSFEANSQGFATNVKLSGNGNGKSHVTIPTPDVPSATAHKTGQSQVSEQIGRSVVVYGVVQPAMAHLMSSTKTLKESLERLAQIAQIAEEYVSTGTTPLSELLSSLAKGSKNAGK